LIIRRKDTLLILIVKIWLAVRFAAVGQIAPYRELRELKQDMRRSEGNTVVGADGAGQAAFMEQALKERKREVFPIGFQRFTQEQVAGGVVGG
jgi:hypothetical protein